MGEAGQGDGSKGDETQNGTRKGQGRGDGPESCSGRQKRSTLQGPWESSGSEWEALREESKGDSKEGSENQHQRSNQAGSPFARAPLPCRIQPDDVSCSQEGSKTGTRPQGKI